MIQNISRIPVFDFCDQVVVYGANGWLGRSAIHYLLQITPHNELANRVLLIGSKKQLVKIGNLNFVILDSAESFNRIRNDSIFINAAFLRREFLQTLSEEAYVKKNLEISKYASRVLEEKKVRSFINLSSGAARRLDPHNSDGLGLVDMYSKLKRFQEDVYSSLCFELGVTFINCRIYSLSGRYLNEFQNLALSSFIGQALKKNRIEVLSPNTRRTYVDSVNLLEFLLAKAIQGENQMLDSGGTLVTLIELARVIASVVGLSNLEVIEGDSKSPDYFGDYQEFNSSAEKMGLVLDSLETQILNTLKAFDL